MSRMTLIASTLAILIAPALSLAETYQGACRLRESDGFSDRNVFVVEIGQKIRGTCKFYIDEFFERRIINANIRIENTARRPMHCEYFVSFYDKKGNLVGCASQGTFSDDGLSPGEETQLGSCLISLPLGMHERVASYKIAFYESTVPIGTNESTR